MATTSTSMYFRYFVYSAEEETLMQKTLGPDVTFGTVSVRGVPKRYTSIVKDMSATKPDAIVLIKGDIRKIKYTPPQRSIS
jgi:hypothetical protein